MANVLFISEYFWPVVQGGGEVNLQLLSKALAKRGINVTVLTSWFPGLKRHEEADGVTIIRQLKTGRSVNSVFGNMSRFFMFERSIIKAVKVILARKRFDAVHLIGSALGAAGGISKIADIKIFATIESYIAMCPKGDFLCGNETETSRWSFGKFVKCLLASDEIGKVNSAALKYNPLFWLLAYRRFTHLESNLKHAKLIAISKFVHNLLKKNYNLESEIVPNFVEVPEKVRRKRTEAPIVTYLGALAEHKGAKVLVTAAKGLRCKVHIYGAGPIRRKLEVMIKKLGVDVKIFDPVPAEKVPEIYSSAAIVVFPSLWPEPFGRIAIEALSYGVPVVASDIGGIKETVPPGTGILVEAGNVKKMHDAIAMLLAHPKWRKERGERGREFAEKNYSEKKVIKKMLDVYGLGAYT